MSWVIIQSLNLNLNLNKNKSIIVKIIKYLKKQSKIIIFLSYTKNNKCVFLK